MSRCAPALCLVWLFAVVAPAQVLVNELDTGTLDAVEFWNSGMSAVDIGGWRVENGAIDPSFVWITETYTIPGPAVVAPGAFAIVRENSGVSVPAGVLVFDDPSNIPWPTAGPGSRGGDCVLVDGATNTGVDMIIWNDPAGANNFFGATFVGFASPTDATLRRNANADTDTASDWSFGGLNLGALNPGQVDPTQPLIEVLVATDGFGSLSWTVNTSNPILPAGQLFNLVSLQDFTPDGGGPLFGIGFDALFQIATPKSPGAIFHTCLDATGSWNLSLPTGTVPPGLHTEFVSFTLGAFGPDRIASVVSLDF